MSKNFDELEKFDKGMKDNFKNYINKSYEFDKTLLQTHY